MNPRALLVIGIVALSMAAGTTGLQSVMPALGRKIGVADWQVAGAFSLSALLWTLASPMWGRISERHGRKRLMLLGLGGFAVSMLGCGVDVLAGLHGVAPPLWIFGGFAVLRAIYGLLGSAAGVASQAYVADHTAHRGRNWRGRRGLARSWGRRWRRFWCFRGWTSRGRCWGSARRRSWCF